MAGWLGLERIVVEGRGDLAPALQAVLGGTGFTAALASTASPDRLGGCHGSARKAGAGSTGRRNFCGRLLWLGRVEWVGIGRRSWCGLNTPADR